MIQDIAPHKYYVDYQPSVPNDTDLVLIYGHHTILCNFEDPEIRYPSIAEIAAVFPEIKEKAKFLFRIDETDYYELRSPQLPEFGIWKYENTLILRSAVPGWLGFAGITGYQIHTWYTDHTYCGRCGTKMHAPGNERAMQCPSCGALSYPVICPSVIVAITDDDACCSRSTHLPTAATASTPSWPAIPRSVRRWNRRCTVKSWKKSD